MPPRTQLFIIRPRLELNYDIIFRSNGEIKVILEVCQVSISTGAKKKRNQEIETLVIVTAYPKEASP